MRTLILALMMCVSAAAATQRGVSYNPATDIVTQTNLTQTFRLVNVTEEVNVGLSGQQGVITLLSTNATHTNDLFIDVDGFFTFQIDGTPIAYVASEGSIYARRLLALSNSDLNADDFVRIQPTDFLMNAGTTTNDLFIDISAGTIRMRHEGTNTFTLVQDSGYLGSGTNFLSDNGTYSSGPSLWQQAFTDKAVTRGDITGVYFAETSPGSGIYLVRIFPTITASPGNHAFFMDTGNDMGTNGVILINNATVTSFFVQGDSGYTGAGTLVLTDDGTYKSIAGASGVTATSTNTFTNKTYDSAATGNVFSERRSIKLQIPRFVDGVGCISTNTNYVAFDNFMVPIFSGSADTNANYCYWIVRVPKGFDTSVEVTASLSVTIGGSDADAATFTLGMVSVANGSPVLSATAANYNTITVTPTSAAAGDGESSNDNTMTGWAAATVANQFWKIQLQRVDGSNDDPIAAQELEIFYTWKSQ